MHDAYHSWDTYNRERKEEVERKWKNWSVFMWFSIQMKKRGGFKRSVTSRIRSNLTFEIMFHWPYHTREYYSMNVVDENKKVRLLGGKAQFIMLYVLR